MTDDKCPYCSNVIQRTDKSCPQCGRGLTGRALLAAPPGSAAAATAGAAFIKATTVPTGAGLMLVASVVAAGVGFVLITPATAGVGAVCLGCALAAWARVAQAGVHHREHMAALHARQVQTSAQVQ